MKDLTPKGFDQGKRTMVETDNYYYVPDPEGGGLMRERAVIACTVVGRIGPFQMTRRVTYYEWILDFTDERFNE